MSSLQELPIAHEGMETWRAPRAGIPLEGELLRATTAEVRFDPGTRAIYSTDASNYRQVPLGVVIPRTVDDVVATVEVYRRHRVPLTSRGGGTSLAGQSTNRGVTLDFSKYLDQVVWIDPERRLAHVEPGCVRKRMPPGVEVTAGEYAFEVYDVVDLIDSDAVDVIQVDITRCGGITGPMAASETAHFRHAPVSTHTAPQAHLHPAAAVTGLRRMEWFHDHIRIESLLFDGTAQPEDGFLTPETGASGTGLNLRRGVLPELESSERRNR